VNWDKRLGGGRKALQRILYFIVLNKKWRTYAKQSVVDLWQLAQAEDADYDISQLTEL
jgi:hypothetical protein